MQRQWVKRQLGKKSQLRVMSSFLGSHLRETETFRFVYQHHDQLVAIEDKIRSWEQFNFILGSNYSTAVEHTPAEQKS